MKPIPTYTSGNVARWSVQAAIALLQAWDVFNQRALDKYIEEVYQSDPTFNYMVDSLGNTYRHSTKLYSSSVSPAKSDILPSELEKLYQERDSALKLISNYLQDSLSSVRKADDHYIGAYTYLFPKCLDGLGLQVFDHRTLRNKPISSDLKEVLLRQQDKHAAAMRAMNTAISYYLLV